MEIIGKLQNLTLDFMTGLPIISFVCTDKRILAEAEKLKEKELSIEVKQYRKKRSLDQNSYFHVLLSKLAEALKVSKPYMKNFLLNRYGQYDTMDGKLIEFILKDDLYDDVEQWENIHLKPTSHTTEMGNGQLYRLYYKLKGSHEMNTEEMNALIDGTISECRDCGIVTDTPDALARMKALWGEQNEKRTG